MSRRALLLICALSLVPDVVQAGKPGARMSRRTVEAFFVNAAPVTTRTYEDKPALIFLTGPTGNPVRVEGTSGGWQPGARGKLVYEADGRYGVFHRLVSFTPQGASLDAWRTQASLGPRAQVLLAAAVSPEQSLDLLRTLKRSKRLDEEAFAWSLRFLGQVGELTTCAAVSEACVYERAVDLLQRRRWKEADKFLAQHGARFDRVAAAVHDARDLQAAPVRARGRWAPPTGASWAALLRAAASKRPAPQARWLPSTQERQHEGVAPPDHILFRHDRPRLLWQQITAP